MNYYEHHIGDYRKDTSHLSLLEHGIYRQLLDTYYTDEKPLVLDHAKLMRSHSVRSADEVQAFENVLADFFERTEDGYLHKRCEAVIGAYRAKSNKASESAKARWNKERCEGNADAMRTHTEGNANHKPVTNNHKPVKAEARATRLPADWEPNDGDVAFCRDERPDLLPSQVASQFRDYWVAQPGAKGRKMDWPATWRNWVRNQRATAGPRQTHSYHDERAETIAALTGRNRHEYESGTEEKPIRIALAR